MVGDGVNDVPALKASRLAIAQGSGSEMARSVADVVLVNGDFAAVPEMVAQGRKILRNIQRVTKLFVAKSAFAAFLILSIGLTNEPYPLLPRHLTLAATLTVGIPAFFLALAPSSGPWRTDGFLREVGRFAVPAGTAAGIGVLSSYLFALNVAGVPLEEARTAATAVLIGIGLYLVIALEATPGSRRTWVVGLVAGLVVAFLVVMSGGRPPSLLRADDSWAVGLPRDPRRNGRRDRRPDPDRRPLPTGQGRRLVPFGHVQGLTPDMAESDGSRSRSGARAASANRAIFGRDLVARGAPRLGGLVEAAEDRPDPLEAARPQRFRRLLAEHGGFLPPA